MWHYYIAKRETFDKYIAHTEERPGSHIAEGHYFDLDGGEICLVVKFHEPRGKKLFDAEPGVTALPNWMLIKSVGPHVAGKLAHHGVQESHTTFETAQLLIPHHPKFDPEFLD